MLNCPKSLSVLTQVSYLHSIITIIFSLGMDLIEWHVKSTTKASQGLYEYDAVTRLRDSQLGDERVKDIKNYIKKGKLWEAFESDKQVVLFS